MKINIVPSEGKGWIIWRTIRELQERNNWTVSKFDPLADVNVFMCFGSATKFIDEIESRVTKTAAFFTHPENTFFYYLANKVDVPIFCCEKYALLPNSYVIPLGIDEVFHPTLRIGNVGRVYSSGRKGTEILDSVISLDGVALVSPPDISKLGEDLYLNALSEYYNSIDFYLVTSFVEGGPMPAAEAKRVGCKVIAPQNVGHCDLFADHFYNRREDKSLINLLKYLRDLKVNEVTSVSKWSWSNFAVNFAKALQ